MDKEPAVIISALTAFATAVIGVLVVFGIDMSDDQRNAVIGVIAPTVIVIAMLGGIIRQFVVPVAKAEDKIEEAYTADPRVDDMPKL
jgi:hypothetical protein